MINSKFRIVIVSDKKMTVHYPLYTSVAHK